MNRAQRPHVAISDTAASLVVLRDIFNPLIGHTRRDWNLNLELDPDGDLPIMKGYRWQRNPATEHGPSPARPLTPREQIAAQAKMIIEEAKTHPARATLRTIVAAGGLAVGLVPGFGWVSIATTAGGSTLTGIPTFLKAGKHIPSDWQAYRQQKKRAKQTHGAIVQLAEDLRARD